MRDEEEEDAEEEKEEEEGLGLRWTTRCGGNVGVAMRQRVPRAMGAACAWGAPRARPAATGRGALASWVERGALGFLTGSTVACTGFQSRQGWPVISWLQGWVAVDERVLCKCLEIESDLRYEYMPALVHLYASIKHLYAL